MADGMPVSVSIALVTLLAVLTLMGGEALLSSFNAGLLRARGGVEPADDVYRTMQWAYPACFVAMAGEGAMTGPAPPEALGIGLAVFGFAKALKMWAITSLGWRWTFRVIVPPDAPLVTRGPYRWLRHPNYLAVLGELAGVAAVVWAPISGAVAIVGFGSLMRRRIVIEEAALGMRPPGAAGPGVAETSGDSQGPRGDV
jgi:methyltransferase